MSEGKSPIKITSPQHLEEVKGKNIVVIADFHAEWCGPCKQIEPFFLALSEKLSKTGAIAFVKINVDEQKEIASAYKVTSIPTFLVWRRGQSSPEKVKGADPRHLQELIRKIVADVENAGEGSAAGPSSSGSGDPVWRGADIPRGYSDITNQIEPKGSEALNADTDVGSVRVLFDSSKPSSIQGEKNAKDWVESDTDEQLMLFMPFQSMLKLHTLQFTSLPPNDEDVDEDERPMRPKTLKLYTNKPHNLGFDEADSTPPTQTIVLTEKDWNANGTANVGLRFVKFQNITSLVVFVVDGDGTSEKVRLDRVRLIGESGEKRDMGKLEKIGDEAGE